MVSGLAGIDDRTTLSSLVRRIARGDKTAFHQLYTSLHSAVREDAAGILSRGADVPAVVSSTFVEVWWLARHHTGTDVRAWIAGIVAFRAHERERGPAADESAADDSHVDLARLLGESATSVRARCALSA